MKRFYFMGALALLLNSFYSPSVMAKSETLANYVSDLAKTDTDNLAMDDPDHNPRYIGINPNNYVSFNGELWRIIGVFDGHVKLIRGTTLGRYSYDSSSKDVNEGMGVNSWTHSDLMNELNGDYLNTELTENTKWYNGIQDAKSKDFDYTKVISTDAQELIEDYTWKLGSPNVVDGEYSNSSEKFTASSLYYYERNGKNAVVNPGGTRSNDGLEREDTWTGKIGLAYPSDMLYAAGSNENITKERCQSSGQWRFDNNECRRTTWMDGITGWFISSRPVDGENIYVFSWISALDGNATAWTSNVTPVLYLKKNVVLVSGTGTSEDPYMIELEKTPSVPEVEPEKKPEEEPETEPETEPKPEIKPEAESGSEDENKVPGVPDTGAELKSLTSVSTSVLVGASVGAVVGLVASRKKIRELLKR